MSRKMLEIEHNGKTYTTRTLAVLGKWKEHYARELIKDVIGGVRTMDEVLKMAVGRHRKTSRKNFKYFHKEKVDGKWITTIFTVKMIMDETGLTELAAWKRLKRVSSGKRKLSTIFDPPRCDTHPKKNPRNREPKGRLSHLSDEMTPERKRASLELSRTTNQNELLRS